MFADDITTASEDIRFAVDEGLCFVSLVPVTKLKQVNRNQRFLQILENLPINDVLNCEALGKLSCLTWECIHVEEREECLPCGRLKHKGCELDEFCFVHLPHRKFLFSAQTSLN